MQTVDTDSNLRSEPEFIPVIKVGRCIPAHSRRINLTQKFLRQELWKVLINYNLLRKEMPDIAQE